jgi:hypothetical protein
VSVSWNHLAWPADICVCQTHYLRVCVCSYVCKKSIEYRLETILHRTLGMPRKIELTVADAQAELDILSGLILQCDDMALRNRYTARRSRLVVHIGTMKDAAMIRSQHLTITRLRAQVNQLVSMLSDASVHVDRARISRAEVYDENRLAWFEEASLDSLVPQDAPPPRETSVSPPAFSPPVQAPFVAAPLRYSPPAFAPPVQAPFVAAPLRYTHGAWNAEPVQAPFVAAPPRYYPPAQASSVSAAPVQAPFVAAPVQAPFVAAPVQAPFVAAPVQAPFVAAPLHHYFSPTAAPVPPLSYYSPAADTDVGGWEPLYDGRGSVNALLCGFAVRDAVEEDFMEL